MASGRRSSRDTAPSKGNPKLVQLNEGWTNKSLAGEMGIHPASHSGGDPVVYNFIILFRWHSYFVGQLEQSFYNGNYEFLFCFAYPANFFLPNSKKDPEL